LSAIILLSTFLVTLICTSSHSSTLMIHRFDFFNGVAKILHISFVFHYSFYILICFSIISTLLSRPEILPYIWFSMLEKLSTEFFI
jgi:hypothetical protein